MFTLSIFAVAVIMVVAIHAYMLRKTARDHDMMLAGLGADDDEN